MEYSLPPQIFNVSWNVQYSMSFAELSWTRRSAAPELNDTGKKGFQRISLIKCDINNKNEVVYEKLIPANPLTAMSHTSFKFIC